MGYIWPIWGRKYGEALVSHWPKVKWHPGAAVRSAARSFAVGLSTQLSNPKTAIVYAGVFAAFLPAAPSLTFAVWVVGLVFCIEAGWYALVVVALSSEHPQCLFALQGVGGPHGGWGHGCVGPEVGRISAFVAIMKGAAIVANPSFVGQLSSVLMDYANEP